MVATCLHYLHIYAFYNFFVDQRRQQQFIIALNRRSSQSARLKVWTTRQQLLYVGSNSEERVLLCERCVLLLCIMKAQWNVFYLLCEYDGRCWSANDDDDDVDDNESQDLDATKKKSPSRVVYEWVTTWHWLHAVHRLRIVWKEVLKSVKRITPD